MQLYTILLLVLLVIAAAHAHPAPSSDALSPVDDYLDIQGEVPAHDHSPRTKRGLLLLKKKLLLGVLGLKAAKIGAVGVAGALALKKAKSVGAASFGGGGASYGSYGYSSSFPDWHVSVRSW